MPHSGMPGADGAGVAQHEHGVLGDLQSGIVDARAQLGHAVEDDGRPLVAQQRWIAACGLMTAPSGARLPRSTTRAPFPATGRSRGRITSSL